MFLLNKFYFYNRSAPLVLLCRSEGRIYNYILGISRTARQMLCYAQGLYSL
ncbi:hypothetical protein PORCAN_64 [Porphyromonas crevioricanis JCM 13913]|nr:hypothetical protein PORCAN_64 [Porphyromonas crevioricanis JCM 13913]